MTVIECYTEAHIDNISASLRLKPEKMILVGDAQEMQQSEARYRKLLQNRGQKTTVSLCDTQGMDYSQICAAFYELVSQESDCVIDLTGGDEVVIMAVGAVVASLPPQRRKTLQVQKYDHEQGAVLDCLNHNSPVPGEQVALSVEELILLHGGSLHPAAQQLPANCDRREIDRVWSIVVEDPRNWNRAISTLAELERRSASKMEVYVSRAFLRGDIKNFEEKWAIVQPLLDTFSRKGIIHDESNAYALSYSYTSPLLRYCTAKAGNILEIKTLLEGQMVSEKGKGFFHDCAMSVSIDWDGVIHAINEGVADTRNEIDVILMRGTTPLFISCKNGDIGEEELYKLNTVATQFGGRYVRKMLIATELSKKGATAFRQRAWDMDIFLVTDAMDLSKEEWQTIFKKAVL